MRYSYSHTHHYSSHGIVQSCGLIVQQGTLFACNAAFHAHNADCARNATVDSPVDQRALLD